MHPHNNLKLVDVSPKEELQSKLDLIEMSAMMVRISLWILGSITQLEPMPSTLYPSISCKISSSAAMQVYIEPIGNPYKTRKYPSPCQLDNLQNFIKFSK